MTIEAQFIAPTLGEDELLFSHLDAREALGRLPEFRMELVRGPKKSLVKADKLLGKSAALKILHEKGDRFIHGVVTRFERGGTLGQFDVYRLELRPWLWHLTVGADCRIFQDQDAVEIIKAVFADYPDGSAVSYKQTGSFHKRPYTVQYRESDFDFVTRLMEEEGLYYYFTYEKEKHTLVLCNGPGGHQAMPGEALEWQPTQGRLREDVVERWVRSHALRPLKYAHTDFAPDEPTVDMMASAEFRGTYPAPKARYEIYDYPGGHEDLAMAGGSGGKVEVGNQRAQHRADAFESGYSVAAALTPERRLTVGTTFDLKEHAEDNGGYLVTEAIYSMEFRGYDTRPEALETEYTCQFEAVPKAVHFQPERSGRQALVLGPQTAIVVGPEGEEIYTDKHGRVKVQFHWDRKGKKNEHSSCWLRVSHPWAGKGYGFVALPRVKDEVVVEFLEGNPDRPLITGRVYNGVNTAPWKLPEQKTVSGMRSRSSKGGGDKDFNELRFDDKKGTEYVWFQAQKDYHQWVKNDAQVTVEGNRSQEVKKDEAFKVGGKLDGDVAKEVTLKIGTDTHGSVGGDLILKIGGKTHVAVTGAIAASAQSADVKTSQGVKLDALEVHLKAKTSIVIDAGVKISLKAGAAFITLGPDGVSISGPIVKINSGGSADSASAPSNPAAPKDPAALKDHKDPLA
jgi:type VI secretion system secreted protein VgrG